MNMGHHFLENFGVPFSFFPFHGIARKDHRQEIQANKLFFFLACEPMQVVGILDHKTQSHFH